MSPAPVCCRPHHVPCFSLEWTQAVTCIYIVIDNMQSPTTMMLLLSQARRTCMLLSQHDVQSCDAASCLGSLKVHSHRRVYQSTLALLQGQYIISQEYSFSEQAVFATLQKRFPHLQFGKDSDNSAPHRVFNTQKVSSGAACTCQTSPGCIPKIWHDALTHIKVRLTGSLWAVLYLPMGVRALMWMCPVLLEDIKLAACIKSA